MTDRPTPPAAASVRAALLGVIDPELGDNIVDLGMVRQIAVAEDGQVDVEVALTIAGCPLRTQLRADVEGRVGSLPGVTSVRVALGEMTAAERAALMDKARHKAQEDRAVATDIPPSARILAVSSGKGGVGKSSVTVNLAVALARRGLTVGLLDADIWGFSVPRMLGMTGELRADDSRKILPLEQAVGPGLVKVVSMGFLADEDTAIMWRGLILNRAVQQFLEDVRWGAVDYLLIDMPPGTGDVQMGLARMLPRTEILVVTTPPLAAQKVASRAADMARKGHLRVAGVIENMSSFTCDHGTTYSLFGEGGGARLAAEIGVPLVGTVPLHPDMSAAGDAGQPVALGSGPLAAAFDTLATALADTVAPVVETAGCTARLLEKVELAVGPPAERGIPDLVTGGRTRWHIHPGVRSGDQLSIGERAADGMRSAMGSWPFVFVFFAIIVGWALLNTLLLSWVLHHKAFDPYPYILLNLFLSMVAGVQAAFLLIAAKRTDAIASEIAIHTENNTDDIKRLIAENTAITAHVRDNTDLLDEIHRHVMNIGKKVGADVVHSPLHPSPARPSGGPDESPPDESRPDESRPDERPPTD